MIANILRFTAGDVGVTLSGFVAVWHSSLTD
jgi:hypothetical protein